MRYRRHFAALLAAGLRHDRSHLGWPQRCQPTRARPLVGGPRASSTIDVIGGIPYGADKLAHFPTDTAQINADPNVSLVGHLGDIKNGSSLCTDDYFALIRSLFDKYEDPFV